MTIIVTVSMVGTELGDSILVFSYEPTKRFFRKIKFQ